MPSERLSRIALPLAAFVVGAIALVVALLLALGPQPGAPGSGVASVGGPFSLTAQDGRTVRDTDVAGSPFLVFFGFTHCPDVCPTTLYETSEMFRALGPDAGKARALFITVDPERDTPEVMRSYLSSFDDRIVGLTGSPQAVKSMTKAYKVYAKRVPLKDGDYTMDHTALVYLMDKSGRFAGAFNLKRPPAEAAADFRRYL
jgi:protein SCO1